MAPGFCFLQNRNFYRLTPSWGGSSFLSDHVAFIESVKPAIALSHNVTIPAQRVLDEPLIGSKALRRNQLFAEIDQISLRALGMVADPRFNRALKGVRVKHTRTFLHEGLASHAGIHYDPRGGSCYHLSDAVQVTTNRSAEVSALFR